MAYPGHPFHVPMFPIPSVTWASALGSNSVGKFPNPKSVLRICNNTEAQEFLGRGGQVIIRMRGLPYDCTAKQVIDFFNTGGDPCDVLDEDHGVLFVKKPDGRATGDAFVLFKEEGDGEKALQKHKEVIGSSSLLLAPARTVFGSVDCLMRLKWNTSWSFLVTMPRTLCIRVFTWSSTPRVSQVGRHSSRWTEKAQLSELRTTDTTVIWSSARSSGTSRCSSAAGRT